LKGTEKAVRAIGDNVILEQRRLWFYNASATPVDVLMRKTITWYVSLLHTHIHTHTHTHTNKQNHRGPTLRSRDSGPQIGGFVLRVNTTSDNVRLRFVTIREAGHMTPAYAPMKTLHTLNALLSESRLSPPFPEDFFDVNDRDFYNSGVFAGWVQDARRSNLASFSSD